VNGNKPTVALFKHFQIDPHFYELHIGIDNAASGHGYKAKRAVELYMDSILQQFGEEYQQVIWQRIWTGF
jgi:hypothetical protein